MERDEDKDGMRNIGLKLLFVSGKPLNEKNIKVFDKRADNSTSVGMYMTIHGRDTLLRNLLLQLVVIGPSSAAADAVCPGRSRGNRRVIPGCWSGHRRAVPLQFRPDGR